MPSPDPAPYAELGAVDALSPSDAWAVGSFSQDARKDPFLTLTEHWDGASWSVVQSPSPGHYNGFSGVLALSHDDVWAVGTSSGRRSLDRTMIEHWDGSAWSVVPSPGPGSASNLYDIMEIGDSGNLWAVGAWQPTVFDPYAPLIERWNGSRWKVVPVPSPPDGGYLFGGTGVSADDAWVVGEAGLQDSRPLAEHWDGTSWAIVPAGPADQGYLNGVAAVSSQDVWAVGRSSLGQSLIEHWNGSTWSAVPTPKRKRAQLEAVAVRPVHSVWTVGSRSPDGNRYLTLTERWNGNGWRAVPSPSGSYLQSGLFAISAIPGTEQMWAVGDSNDGHDLSSALIELYS